MKTALPLLLLLLFVVAPETHAFSSSPFSLHLSPALSLSSLSRRRSAVTPPTNKKPWTSTAPSNNRSSRKDKASSRLLASFQNDADDHHPTKEVESTTTNNNSMRQRLQDTIFLGLDPTPDIIAIATIYFVEGALGLSRLAQTFYFKDQLHLGPAELSALSGLLVLPWTIKPLYGFLSDGVPLFGYKRRSYLIVAGLLGCLAYTALGQDFWGLIPDTIATTEGTSATTTTITTNPAIIQATLASLLISSGCIAFSDVVADGIVVQKTREASEKDPSLGGSLQSLCWGSAALGGLLSAYYSGSLLEIMTPQAVFQYTAVLPFIVACIALVIEEEPVQKLASNSISDDDSASIRMTTNGSIDNELLAELTSENDTLDGIKAQVAALWDALKQPSIWKPTLFLFLWQSTPTSDGAFLYFMTSPDQLGFGPEFLGRVRLVTAGAGLLGVYIYNRFLKTVAIKDILFWSSIIATPLGLSTLLLITHANRELGIPDAAFVFGDDVALAILGQIAFMPTLVLAARLCPPGVEAVLFATLMSIYNGAGTVGTEIGAGLTKYLGVTETNFDNLGLLTIICNLSGLYPLVFIGWLDEVGSASENDDDDGEASSSLQLEHAEKSVMPNGNSAIGANGSGDATDGVTSEAQTERSQGNVCYSEEDDEMLVADAVNLPRGSKEGFAVLQHFEFTGNRSQFSMVQEILPEKDIGRLGLRPENVTLPVALMMVDPQRFPTISRARKSIRKLRIVLHRGALGARGVFTPERTSTGRVGDRVYPGDIIGRQVAVGTGYYRMGFDAEKKAPPFELPVILEDSHMAIVNKPAGVVIYSPKNAGLGLMTVKSALPHALKPPLKGTIGALKRPKSVHRLDKATSGLLIIGKTLPSMEHLSSQFRDRVVKKTYTAIINGKPKEDPDGFISSRQAYELGVDVDPDSDEVSWQLIDSPLKDNTKDVMRNAVTIWRVVKSVNSVKARDGVLTMVELKPKTGRYHQLRRHMAWICDRAIVGDKEYDGNHESAVKLRGRGLFLCSNRVTLEHPFYNTRAGREVWDTLPEAEKVFEEGKLWCDPDSDKVMVSASIELPQKYRSFMDRSEAVYQKYAVAEDMVTQSNFGDSFC